MDCEPYPVLQPFTDYILLLSSWSIRFLVEDMVAACLASCQLDSVGFLEDWTMLLLPQVVGG
jgi:hypothetical protein